MQIESRTDQPNKHDFQGSKTSERLRQELDFDFNKNFFAAKDAKKNGADAPVLTSLKFERPSPEEIKMKKELDELNSSRRFPEGGPPQPLSAPDEKLYSNSEKQLAESFAKLSPQVNERIKQDLEDLRTRRDDENLPVSEVMKTFDQVERLLKSESSGLVSKENSETLAEQIVEHTAHSHRIDQGDHPTCNVTTLESQLFSKKPSAAAKIIVDTALSGTYTSQDGSKSTLSKEELSPDKEALQNPPADGKRSYASEVFQKAVLNLTKEPSSDHYREVTKLASSGQPEPTSEYLKTNGKTASFDGLTMQGIADIGMKITGIGNPNDFIAKKTYVKGGGLEKIRTFDTAEDLRETLTALKLKHQFPVILEVDTAKGFLADNSFFGAGGGAHVITITDYDMQRATVNFANQWGAAASRIDGVGMPLSDIYEVTKAPQEN